MVIENNILKNMILFKKINKEYYIIDIIVEFGLFNIIWIRIIFIGV